MMTILFIGNRGDAESLVLNALEGSVKTGELLGILAL